MRRKLVRWLKDRVGELERLHRERLANAGMRYAEQVLKLCANGDYEEAIRIERSKLNPIQETLGASVSNYAQETQQHVRTDRDPSSP